MIPIGTNQSMIFVIQIHSMKPSHFPDTIDESVDPTGIDSEASALWRSSSFTRPSSWSAYSSSTPASTTASSSRRERAFISTPIPRATIAESSNHNLLCESLVFYIVTLKVFWKYIYEVSKCVFWLVYKKFYTIIHSHMLLGNGEYYLCWEENEEKSIFQ